MLRMPTLPDLDRSVCAADHANAHGCGVGDRSDLAPAPPDQWDEAKREANLAKHGVDFVDARAVFADPFRLERSDERHDYGEERRQTIGAVGTRVLFIVYIDGAPYDASSQHEGQAKMSANRISQVVVGRDGKPRRRLPGDRLVLLKGKTDWKRLDRLSDAQIATRDRLLAAIACSIWNASGTCARECTSVASLKVL